MKKTESTARKRSIDALDVSFRLGAAANLLNYQQIADSAELAITDTCLLILIQISLSSPENRLLPNVKCLEMELPPQPPHERECGTRPTPPWTNVLFAIILNITLAGLLVSYRHLWKKS